jgi:pimeloyl-ACP methyl ester carboxylesterase
LLLLGFVGSSCASSDNTFTVWAYQKEVIADDGYKLEAYDLHLEGHSRQESPKAWLFYLIGSEPVSILDSTGQFADFVKQGVCVVLLQPRGVARDGSVDLETFRRYETRQRRSADQLAVMEAYLAESENLPVMLVGSSQGGVVAAEVATLDFRVSHLLLMASGGGWTQAEELEFLVEQNPGYLGMADTNQLKAKFDEINAAQDSDQLWAGHPFRMWNSYLWFSSMDELTKQSIPILLAHGSADKRVPVESARAMRDEFVNLGLDNLTYLEFEGLDHNFNDTDGKNKLIELQEYAYAWMIESAFL